MIVVALGLIVVATWALWSRARASRYPVINLGPVVTLGKTPLRILYSKDGEGALIGYLDTRAAKVYVNEAEAEGVRRALGATDAAGGWSIRPGGVSRVYATEAIAWLDRGGPLLAGNVAVLKDRDCFPYPRGTCINFYRGETFAYSWRATDDTWFCASAAGKTCKEELRTNPVTLYPEKDCKGTPYPSTETWRFCIPA